MTCDSGANGSPKSQQYVGKLPGLRSSNGQIPTGAQSWDNPMEFALFGLARQDQFPDWVKTDWTKPVLDLGPGNKIIHGAIRCEYPEYNFENLSSLPIAYPAEVARPGVDTSKGFDPANYWSDGYKDDISEYRCTLPYDDNSIGGIYAVNILEHLWDPRPIMEECARVLAPGAPLNIVVPHGSHGIYLQDLDHKKPFILDTWKNWLQNGYWGPDRSHLRLRVGANFKFGIKEENVNIMTQLIKTDNPWEYPGTHDDEAFLEGEDWPKGDQIPAEVAERTYDA